MKNLTLSRIALLAAMGLVLVLAGVGIGAMVTGDGQPASQAAAAATEEESRPGRDHRIDPDLREVLSEIRREIAEQAPEVAEPILDEAVADDRITEEQADRIRERIEHFGERGDRFHEPRGGPGFGDRGGRFPGPPGPPDPPGRP